MHKSRFVQSTILTKGSDGVELGYQIVAIGRNSPIDRNLIDAQTSLSGYRFMKVHKNNCLTCAELRYLGDCCEWINYTGERQPFVRAQGQMAPILRYVY